MLRYGLLKRRAYVAEKCPNETSHKIKVSEKVKVAEFDRPYTTSYQSAIVSNWV